jgi:hypothetical protein
MRRLLIFLAALLLVLPARGETAQANDQAQLAAGAVVSMHNAVMRDVLGGDFAFSDLVGNEASLLLYSDPDRSAYLLVAMDEDTLSRAETAVLQTYDLSSIKNRAALSLRALALPFLLDDEQAAFDDWLGAQLDAMEAAYYAGEDYELNYSEATYVSCGASLYHADGGVLFTLIAHWYTPLSADDITSLMED